VQVTVVGASGAGAFAALLLARAGHRVVVLERDRLEPAPDVEAAADAAFRPTAPQIVQPHIVMARCRELLRERLPDVYAALLAAGVVEASLATQMPASLADRAPRPGDERLAMLMSRRSTIDWVLQRALRAEPGVAVRDGVRALGLLAAPGDPPRVTGVRTDQGEVPSDLVVDATGRRSAIDAWLDELGAKPTATWRAECGVAYFSRHYRLRPGAELPGPPTTRIVAGLDEFLVGIWGADNGAMQLAVGPLDTDRRFRTLKQPEVFTAVLRTVPTFAAWLDALDPISGVFPMGAVHNSLRRLVVGGVPVALGLHALGDAVCTTNPTLGRGLSLALWGAADLVDVLAVHPADRPGAGAGRARGRSRRAVLRGPGRHRWRAAGGAAAYDLRRAGAGPAAPGVRPGHLRGVAGGGAVRPDGVSRVLADHGDARPARRGLRRSGGRGRHAGGPPPPRGRAAAGRAHARPAARRARGRVSDAAATPDKTP
jgi:2-polyprenyl-6-methoxyphenol hydroxylase-like FAD-dependent oxidoreductase